MLAGVAVEEEPPRTEVTGWLLDEAWLDIVDVVDDVDDVDV